MRLRPLRSRRRESELNSPRLIFRFAVLTGLGLAIAGACIFVLVRGFIVKQQEDSVMRRARLVAQVVLAGQVRPTDFQQPSARRVAQLDTLFRQKVLVDGVVRAALYSPSGRLAYSTLPVVRSRTPDSAMAHRVAQGQAIRSVLAKRNVNGDSRQMLEEFVPIRFSVDHPSGTLVLWNDYAPIASAARSAFVPISLVLELLLVVLFLGLVPMLRRVTRQVKAHLADSERRALHDELTGLPNRSLFNERLELALAGAAGEVAVMLIDLDRFKEINDTLGHASGDELLHELGDRLSAVVGEGDTVARLGGDEFGVVLAETRLERACAVARRMIQVTEEPFAIEGLTLTMGASVGIALYPRHGAHAATLLKHADVAMYEAKRAGIAYAVYDPEADSHHADLLSLASEMRVAVQRGEMVAHYQPVVDVRTGEIEGMEALLRWNHPTRGLLAAAEFIPLADQIGIVPALSDHALRLAVRQCSEWHAEGRELTVAVNLDARSLLDPQLPERVADLLDFYDVDPRWLELEITETSLMGDQDRVRKIASELTDTGVKLVIDDFAAGYTSLHYLTQLPISKLKIDRSLIAGATAAPARFVVAGIIEIAHNLGLDVVAEGIEDEATFELVRSLQSDLAQGYYLGHPTAAPALPPVREGAIEAA